MGGGAKRRSTKSIAAGKRGPHFVSSGSESSGTRSRSIGYSYAYPSDPIQLTTLPEVEDRSSTDIYNTPLVGGAGLGYEIKEDEEEETEEEGGAGLGFEKTVSDEEEVDYIEKEDEEKFGNEGFITIGGVRVYTEDCSSPESDSETENSSEDSDDSDSIDEEMADDYLEGISGGCELLKAEWLAAKKILNNEFVLESDCSSDDEKLSRVQMMRASEEYGMMKKSKKKINFIEGSSQIIDIDLCGAMDDLFFGKDQRMVSGRKKKKNVKENIQLARSWPRDGKSKRFFPGEKKKHRKEVIAAKRRQRMINRGVDLEQINLKLKQMVIDDIDIFSFQPMHSRDCSQVQRLASIYRLQSGRQGSGKKRFVTVTQTSHTCLPSAHDKLRLDKILGEAVEEEDFTISNKTKGTPRTQPRTGSNSKKKLFLHGPALTNLAKKHSSSGRKKLEEKKKAPAYSERPISFISSGIMQTDSLTEAKVPESNEATVTTEKTAEATSPSEVGAFEMHTKGFGSKMMAKMGFVEGSGLGKDGQGIVRPVEAVQRPKSLGLGIQFDEAVTDDKNIESGSRSNYKGKRVECLGEEDKSAGKSKNKGKKVEYGNSIGAFEKHTKGFGSKMMARMGFVEGGGLGRDGQGMVSPLTAVRRPKCKGLGSKY